MTDATDVIARQLTRSGETFILAMEPLDEAEFFAENPDGFSAAWVTGHLACVADLFSSWFAGPPMACDAAFHRVFNETAVTGPGEVSKAASVDPELYGKSVLLLTFRRAMVKALTVLRAFDAARWDDPAPSWVPVTLTCGAVWEHLAGHIYWHNGGLAGSMPRFAGTYTLNILPHHLYVPPGVELPVSKNNRDSAPARGAAGSNGQLQEERS